MKMPNEILDVLIIGGGINGAGTALEASRSGLNVGLYEQHDFGFGASTATSKLAHGGLRYLEHYKFKLVKESLKERNFLLKQAPHLVKPMQFCIPLYSNSKWKLWKLRLGLSFYDWMQGERVLPNHCPINKDKISKDIPWLNTNDFIGAVSYYDAQMEDHRIIMELLLMSQDEGAKIHNYSKIIKTEKNEWGYVCDILDTSGTVKSINTKSILAATGAWNNQFSKDVIVKPTKGVHIVLPEMDLPMSLLLMTPQDNRVFFIMPWKGHTLVGTTDQYDGQDYDNPKVSREDTQYLLDAVNAYSKYKKWNVADIKSAFCGYRPILKSNEENESKQSRETLIKWVDKDFLTISGGKYTTYRKIANEAINQLKKETFNSNVVFDANTEKIAFIGKILDEHWPSETNLKQLLNKYHISRESLIHILENYGAKYTKILNVINRNQNLGIQFDIELPMILAELKYCIDNEWVKNIDDFLFRRTYYGYLYFDNLDFMKSVIRTFNIMTSNNLSEKTQINMMKNSYQQSWLL